MAIKYKVDAKKSWQGKQKLFLLSDIFCDGRVMDALDKYTQAVKH